ncbi:MAG: glucose-6-phosphate isomerase, partial [Candidatus Aminicenantes bacterium]|nr:glucose-6-phosphate isomerase [Candidatus Aminicenantes bacterium]NIN16678.1 glucose-6-phosphate isomerase [Candidatus Aminicenantes bacterium]NIR04033.1 glucose-6-phosphate isomerase [Candidatus Aminicenantes bacterium]
TIDDKAKIIRAQFSDYVQLAIGGSALGGIALHNALGNKFVLHSENGQCRVHMPDNIDPDWIGDILNSIKIETTFFNIISKSGGTVETLANFFVFYNALKQKVPTEKLRENIVIMTNPEKGPLAELSWEAGFTLIPIPESVHGRFSVLSPGGLLTAAVSGIDINELLKGAWVMNQLTDEMDFWKNPVSLYAAIHYLTDKQKNIDTLILMPYSQSLRTIGDWYSQLVAESLGKNAQGITPVKALGATDQHSQLQLYNEGPKNKLITFFSVDKFKREIRIPEEFPECKEYQYLWGHTINELIDAERRATAISLYNNGVPNCTFHIPQLTPFYMGQLFMLLEKVIPILGKLYGVNAFNQPGVEESKKYARAMLGKKGKEYDKIRQEVEFHSRANNSRIV